MTKYLKFAASFWMGAFLVAGSFAAAQISSTAKANKSGSTAASSTPAPATSSPSQQQSGAAADTPSSATQSTVAAKDQPSGTTAPAKPKTMIGPDKRTILVPQSN